MGQTTQRRGFGSRGHNEPCSLRTRASEEATAQSALKEEGDEELADQVIKVVLDREKHEWKRLLAVSNTWPDVGPKVLERLRKRIENGENLTWAYDDLARVDEEVAGHRELLAEAKAKEEGEELEALVADRRNEFNEEFFKYVAWIVVAKEENGEEGAEELQTLQERLLSLCEAHDQSFEEAEAMREAGEKIQELLDARTVDDMDKKVEKMAEQGRLDQATMLSAAKMYNSVKESQYTRDEVKEVMAHLYFKMQETQHRQQPAPARILKFLVSIEDPSERLTQLENAFTPGPELETEREDFLQCEPQELLGLCQRVLQAYRNQRGMASMTGEAAQLMNPTVISRIEEIQSDIEQHFM